MLRYEPCPQAWDRAELLGVTSGPASWINDPIGEGREKPFGLVHVRPLEMLLHVHATQQKSDSGFLAFQAGTILQVASRVLAHEFSAEVVRSGPLWALCREHPWRRL